MNKRIKELAADAGYPDYMTYGQDKVLEKFAELIVRECAEYAEQELDMAGYKKKFMLKHFGVEEK
jgi:hypothetical protein